jgi:hypothetical protein
MQDRIVFARRGTTVLYGYRSMRERNNTPGRALYAVPMDSCPFRRLMVLYCTYMSLDDSDPLPCHHMIRIVLYCTYQFRWACWLNTMVLSVVLYR